MSMTFLDMQVKSLARVDETITDTETETLNVIKDAVNNAYMLLCANVDKRTKIITLSLEDYNNKLPLPLDFVELSIVEHEVLGEINPMDYEKMEDILYFKSRDLNSGEITLTYVYYPPKLVADTDELRLKDAYLGAITSYAAYVYQLSKKKYSASELLLREFNSYFPLNAQASLNEQINSSA